MSTSKPQCIKLITLNIWGGHVYAPLLEFISAHQETDIFCLQEVYHKAPHKISEDEKHVHLNIFSELADRLPDHNPFFKPVVNSSYGIGIFIKNHLDVLSEGEISIHLNPHYKGTGPTHSRNLQWLECKAHDQIFSILNVHGLWNGMGKTDTPERIAQSRRIKTFMNSLNTPSILCGDFNVRPDTLSMDILEQGMNNLIKTHHVSSTRTRYYTKEEKFADYILASQEIRVNQFRVLKDEVSDHAPLFLDFSINTSNG